ncbi:MAG TPA: hypothetical protein VF384_00815 [Planctomycetota bacterium]
MPETDRRGFLGGLAAIAIAPPGRATQPQDPASPPDLGQLITIARSTPRDEMVGKAIALHRGGASWRDLLGAAFLAGVRDVRPRPVGYQFHCVLMTASAYQIAEALPEGERVVPALFNLADLKLSQELDARRDWTMPAAPAVAGDRNTSFAKLREGLDAYDVHAADEAATAVWRCSSLDEVFEVLWLYGARDFTNIGHNPIFVAQAHRTLQQVGWRCGEDVVRSLVYGLLDGGPGKNDATFLPNRERAARLRADWRHGKPSAIARAELLATLRKVDAGEAADAVVEQIAGGLALSSVFDALRLFAVEQLWRAPGILAVHALTSCNALRYGLEHCRTDSTQRLMLLQAASWLVLYRDYLAARPNYDHDKPGLDALVAADAQVTAAAVFEAAGEDHAKAAALCLTAAKTGGLEPLGAELRHWLVRKADEHHEYKLAQALLEEMALTEPDVASRLLAGSLGYVRTPGSSDSDVWRQANA